MNILKEKLVMSCLLGSFYLKIVWFKIPLQFYGTVEKVETCDGYGQNLSPSQVSPSFQPSNLLFYFFMTEIEAY